MGGPPRGRKQQTWRGANTPNPGLTQYETCSWGHLPAYFTAEKETPPVSYFLACDENAVATRCTEFGDDFMNIASLIIAKTKK